MAHKYWEDMGWSTEWYYHRYRMRHGDGRLTEAELTAITDKHGDKAMDELTLLAGSGNFSGYIPMLARIKAARAAEPVFAAPAPTADLPLFAF